MAGSEQQNLSYSAGLSLLREHLGREVTRVRRVWFTRGDAILGSEGPLEVTFDDGSTVVLDGGADGESLVITGGTWKDSFGGSSTPENEVWVAEHGKWCAYDLSQDASYQKFLGAHLVSVSAMRTKRGATCGVRLGFDRGEMDFVVSADEAFVFLVAQGLADLAAMNVEEVEEADGAIGR